MDLSKNFSDQYFWIPKTKFALPVLDANTINRERLINLLNEFVTKHKLTLISAPAGSGKTTLAAQYIYDNPELEYIWFRLGPEDDDVTAFITALISAFKQINPFPCDRANNLMTTLPDVQSQWRKIIGLLINDSLSSGLPELIMVLDDYHAIKNQEVHDVCSYLLNNLPANIHLMITSRTDPPFPLAYMQMHNDLFELRLPQLRFEPEETRSYLMKSWNLALTSGELNELQQQTDGWIASLQLLAMSLSHLEDFIHRNSFIAEFGHSKRLIYQLLAEEVLSQQPDDIRNFLLQTSILVELTPELCQAITKNPQASVLLTQVYRRNLFLSAVNDQMSMDNAYRYHDLFSTFLKQRLLETDPDLYRTLHHRAAKVVQEPIKKVQHFIAAEEVEEAAKILEFVGKSELKKEISVVRFTT